MKRIVFTIILVAGIFTVMAPGLCADELTRQKVWAGLELFPAMVAADTEIGRKTTPENTLLLLLVYRVNRFEAEEMAAYLGRVGSIRNIPVSVVPVPFNRLNVYEEKRVGGVFLSESSPGYLGRVTHFGKTHHAIVFSPFEGDVEKGVSGGILIHDMVKPYVNSHALEQAGITLKSFFMNVAERYEP